MSLVYVFNGPNLNLLGLREPQVYGHHSLADVEAMCAEACASHGVALDFRQSNHEGELVTWLQEAGQVQQRGEALGVVLNAGAYTHTSVALHDAIKGAQVTVIELHISNVHAREAFRHHSYISPAAKAVMAGWGVRGYPLAIAGLVAEARG
jgi:3-dehydroquinate dehydratase-2